MTPPRAQGDYQVRFQNNEGEFSLHLNLCRPTWRKCFEDDADFANIQKEGSNECRPLSEEDMNDASATLYGKLYFRQLIAQIRTMWTLE